MEGIDLLQQLTKRKAELSAAEENRQNILNEKLFSFINSINDYNGLKMMPLSCSLRKPWSFKDDVSTFDVRLVIQFYNEEGKTYDDGTIRPDFGSDITVDIFDNYIELNYGCCGSYTSKNKGQLTRIMLIAKLWQNEEEICKIARDNINIKEYDELTDVCNAIDRINNDIKFAQRERERAKIILQIKQGKYLAKAKTQSINGRFEKNEDGTDEHFVCDGKERIYYSFEEIKNVTDKTVMTIDDYWHDNHRRNIDQVIYDIKNGSLVVLREKIDKEPLPEEKASA